MRGRARGRLERRETMRRVFDAFASDEARNSCHVTKRRRFGSPATALLEKCASSTVLERGASSRHKARALGRTRARGARGGPGRGHRGLRSRSVLGSTRAGRGPGRSAVRAFRAGDRTPALLVRALAGGNRGRETMFACLCGAPSREITGDGDSDADRALVRAPVPSRAPLPPPPGPAARRRNRPQLCRN